MPADAAAAPAMVRVDGVSRSFDGTLAVDAVSFDLARGRFLTILGPSGSGKTTLLRMIAGFLTPTGGEIVLNGRPVSSEPPHRRSIGMVFQKLALFPHMTAAENVAYPLRMRRADARTIPDRVERYLDLVRLGGFGRRRIHELSGGQQQRVAIARALVFEPDLLLLDEPLAALDKKLREEMQLEFRRIQRELGVTTINVTHDQREALVMSDEIMVMDGGRAQQIAGPVETYRRPANPFVAGFIGVANLLDGRAAVDGGTVAAFGTLECPATPAGGDPIAAGQPITAAIRAEQLRITDDADVLEVDGPGALDIIVSATVVEAIFEGERSVYAAKVPALGNAVLRVFDHDPAAHRAWGVGQPVYLGWTARDLLVWPR
ncbi:ABC transporter ATP-binding protein [Tistrella bauzanensis]|uniref:ABC transporter ATP-binding protein n=2 Tax=Geminicoccaceae TaxID=2066434 RepID=A0ABU9YM53_9PROT